MLFRHLQRPINNFVLPDQTILHQQLAPGCGSSGGQSGGERHHRSDGDRADAEEAGGLQEMDCYLHVW